MTENSENPRLRYDEGCLGAHALNTVGDRWALLVLRELMFQPKRFQELRAGLPGVTASVLTQRLGQLGDAGLIARHEGGYALTPLGRGLHPVLVALCQWALGLPGHDPRRFISLSALMVSISATVRADQAAGCVIRAGFVGPGSESYTVRLDTQGSPSVDPGLTGCHFTLSGNGNMLARAIYGPQPLADLIAEGVIALHGDAAAAQDFVDLFSLQAIASTDSPDETEQTPGVSSTST